MRRARSTTWCGMAKADLTIRTALLEARYVWGDQRAVRRGCARASARRSSPALRARFIADKLAERDERHRKMGDSRYVVEPNVKEGKGGLRDLHTLFWIGKYRLPGRDASPSWSTRGC